MNIDFSNIKNKLTDSYWNFLHYGGTYLIMRTHEPDWLAHYLEPLLPRGITIDQTPAQNFTHSEKGPSVELSTHRGTKADEWLRNFIEAGQFQKVPYMN